MGRRKHDEITVVGTDHDIDLGDDFIITERRPEPRGRSFPTGVTFKIGADAFEAVLAALGHRGVVKVDLDAAGNVLVDAEPLPGATELRPTVVADRDVPAVDRNGRHFLAVKAGQRILVRRARQLGLTGPAELLAYVEIDEAEAEAIEVDRARRQVGPQGALSAGQIEAHRQCAADRVRWR